MTNPRPGPILSRVLRAPAGVYDHNAGWMFGERFLRLTHLGRTSGQPRQTMLEVIAHDPISGEYMVIAGLGRSANWYRNLQAHDALEVAVGRRRFRPAHRELDPQEAADTIADYEHRHRLLAPIITGVLSWLVGWPYDASEAARARLAAELPVIAFRPASPSRSAASVPVSVASTQSEPPSPVSGSRGSRRDHRRR